MTTGNDDVLSQARIGLVSASVIAGGLGIGVGYGLRAATSPPLIVDQIVVFVTAVLSLWAGLCFAVAVRRAYRLIKAREAARLAGEQPAPD